MTFKTLCIMHGMLKDNVSDLEQKRKEIYESMQMLEGMYEVAIYTGNIEGEKTAEEDLAPLNKEYEKIQDELKEKKAALKEIENAELV